MIKRLKKPVIDYKTLINPLFVYSGITRHGHKISNANYGFAKWSVEKKCLVSAIGESTQDEILKKITDEWHYSNVKVDILSEEAHHSIKHNVGVWDHMSEESWKELQTIAPPQKHQTCQGVEIFKCDRHLSNYHRLFCCRLGGFYFKVAERFDVPYTVLSNKVHEQVKALIAT